MKKIEIRAHHFLFSFLKQARRNEQALYITIWKSF